MTDVVKFPIAGELKISSAVALPSDAVTRTFGILAVRGAGKSNTAAVMAEEMFKAKLPFCVIDPVGSWWGMRSSGDGSGSGLAIPIFGGKHGDLPLERGAGDLVANLIVDKRLSCVIDLSAFDSEGDKKAFLLAFARRLYTRNEDPLHLFLEEADDYIPQKPMRDEAQLLRAWENIVRRGRARGLGITLITQRSAALNKMVLTQVETLIVLRTTGPQDQKAIEAWIEYHQQKRDVMESLSRLEDGEAWIWSPQWLKIMQRVQIRRRWTFDSGATPANVRTKDRRAPATLADVDLAALQEQFKTTIEKAKEEDPRELRRRIAALERDLVAAKKIQPAAGPAEKIEVPILTPVQEDKLISLAKAAHELRYAYDRMIDLLTRAPSSARIADGIQELNNQLRSNHAPPKRKVEFKFDERSRVPLKDLKARGVALPPEIPRLANQSDGSVGTGGLRRMLIALAQRPQGLSVRQLGVRAELSSKSGSFNTYLSRARSQGWIAGTRTHLTITPAGLKALGTFEPLPTGRDLLDHWLHELGAGGAARILSVLAAAYPEEMHKSQIAEAAGLSGNSGSFNTYLSRLRSLELIEGRSHLRASDEFFEG